MSFDNNVKRIDWRSWEKIRATWLSSLPDIQPLGAPPELEISELLEIDRLVSNIPNNGEYQTVVTELQDAIFREAIFLLHKSIGVMLAAEICINNGIKTWSLSTGYQSALFAAKSNLCFLGITLPRVNGIDYLFDIFPEPQKLSKSKIKKGVMPVQQMKFIKMNQLKHYNIWRLFQRTIRVSKVDLWNKSTINFLVNLDPKDFARQRNAIHYKNNAWFLDDLFYPVIDDNFGKVNDVWDTVNNLSAEKNIDFSIIVSFLIVNMCYLLFKDIAGEAPIIEEEFKLCKTNIESSIHHLYNNLLL